MSNFTNTQEVELALLQKRKELCAFHLYYMVVERRFCYWNDFSLDYLRMMRLYLIKTLKRLLKHDNIG